MAVIEAYTVLISPLILGAIYMVNTANFSVNYFFILLRNVGNNLALLPQPFGVELSQDLDMPQSLSWVPWWYGEILFRTGPFSRLNPGDEAETVSVLSHNLSTWIDDG